MEAKKEYHKEPCCCFAPMEGITGYVYRNAHHALFPHVDPVSYTHLTLPTTPYV